MTELSEQTSFFIDPTLLGVIVLIATLLFGIFAFRRKRPILKYDVTSPTFRELSADEIGEDARKFGAEGIFTHFDIGMVVENVGDLPTTIKRAEASFRGATGYDDAGVEIAANESKPIILNIPFRNIRVDEEEITFDLTIDHTHGSDRLTDLVAKKSDRTGIGKRQEDHRSSQPNNPAEE